MATDGYNRYTGGSRPIDDMGEMTPVVEVSESVRPWIKLLPAPYLPTARFDVHKRANVVLSVGTPVALDGLGAAVPAGIPGGHVFEYDAEDYLTGLPATTNPATGAAVTSAVTEAAMNSGLTGNTTGKFLRAVGVSSFDYYQHEGGVAFTSWPAYTLNHDNPKRYAIHNTMSQDLLSITCDYNLLVPYIPDRNLLSDTVKIFDNNDSEVDVLSKKAKSYVFAHDELVRNAGTAVLASGLKLVYMSPNNGIGDAGVSGSGVIGGAIAAATWAVNGVAAGSAVNLTVPGFHILYAADPAKYIVVYNSADKPHAFTAGTVTFTTAPRLVPSDFVVPRVGKFVKYDPARHEADEIVGQVQMVNFNTVNKSLLAHVKTAYERATSAGDMMPGSATRGVPFNLHLVTDGAWRQFSTKKKLDGTALDETGLTTPTMGLVTINLLR